MKKKESTFLTKAILSTLPDIEETRQTCLNQASIKDKFSLKVVPHFSRRIFIKPVFLLIFFCLVIVAITQHTSFSTLATSFYRNITLRVGNTVLPVGDIELINAGTIKNLHWIKDKKHSIGFKEYTTISDAEEELKLRFLRNNLSKSQIPSLSYSPDNGQVDITLNDCIIGDLKNYTEITDKDGNISLSYTNDGTTVYQSPVSIRITLFTDSSPIEPMIQEYFSFLGTYTSTINQIKAYFVSTNNESTLADKKLYISAGEYSQNVIFIYNNQLYTLSGNIPRKAMQEIIDNFILPSN